MSLRSMSLRSMSKTSLVVRYRLALLTVPFLAVGVNAQTAEPHAPAGTTHVRISGITVFPVTGMPFSGTDTMLWVRSGSDGSTVTQYLVARVARDSEGRILRERHHFAPAGVDPAKTLTESLVLDPVAGTETRCTVATHRCRIENYHPRLEPALRPAGVYDNGRRSLTRLALGSQTIEGVPVEGTRETTAIEPSVEGNDKRLLLTDEFWYSPALRTNILVVRDDPREGKVTAALKVDSRSEPEPSVFAIPAGYRVQDARRLRASITSPQSAP